MAQTKKRAGKRGEEEQGGALMKVKGKPRQSASVWLLRQFGCRPSQIMGFYSFGCHQQAKVGWLYNNKTNTTLIATTWMDRSGAATKRKDSNRG